jgi:hypothetical protein
MSKNAAGDLRHRAVQNGAFAPDAATTALATALTARLRVSPPRDRWRARRSGAARVAGRIDLLRSTWPGRTQRG